MIPFSGRKFLPRDFWVSDQMIGTAARCWDSDPPDWFRCCFVLNLGGKDENQWNFVQQERPRNSSAEGFFQLSFFLEGWCRVSNSANWDWRYDQACVALEEKGSCRARGEVMACLLLDDRRACQPFTALVDDGVVLVIYYRSCRCRCPRILSWLDICKGSLVKTTAESHMGRFRKIFKVALVSTSLKKPCMNGWSFEGSNSHCQIGNVNEDPLYFSSSSCFFCVD